MSKYELSQFDYSSPQGARSSEVINVIGEEEEDDEYSLRMWLRRVWKGTRSNNKEDYANVLILVVTARRIRESNDRTSKHPYPAAPNTVQQVPPLHSCSFHSHSLGRSGKD